MDEYEEEPERKDKKSLLLRVSRFCVQLFFFILFGNLAWLGFSIISGSGTSGLPLPIMQSHATPGGIVVGVYDVIMESFTQGIFPFLALGILLIIGILMGRATCGWMCPFGFVLDLCHYVPARKRYPGYQINQQLSKVKFGVLILTLFIAIAVCLIRIGVFPYMKEPLPLGWFTENPFSPIDPATTMQAVIPNLIINPAKYEWPSVEQGFWNIFSWSPWFWFRVIFMIIILLLTVYIGRAWCRWFCPLGAALGILVPYAIIGVQRNLSKCLGKKCRNCELSCPMGVSILREPWEKITHSNCILCLRCYEACDEGAITLSFFSFKQN